MLASRWQSESRLKRTDHDAHEPEDEDEAHGCISCVQCLRKSNRCAMFAVLRQLGARRPESNIELKTHHLGPVATASVLGFVKTDVDDVLRGHGVQEGEDGS